MQTAGTRPRTRFVAGGIALLGLALLMGAVGWGFGRRQTPTFHGTTYAELTPAPPITLRDSSGRPVTLDTFRGEAVLLFFGFTHCPDACPLTLSKLSRVLARLGGGAEKVRVVLITMDPTRDTPAALGGYVGRFTPRAVGLTGDSASLAEAYRGYGAYSRHDEQHGLTHSTAIYGIDPAGRLRVVIPIEASEEAVEADVRTLLALR
jgi:protein SCO1/2